MKLRPLRRYIAWLVLISLSSEGGARGAKHRPLSEAGRGDALQAEPNSEQLAKQKYGL